MERRRDTATRDFVTKVQDAMRRSKDRAGALMNLFAIGFNYVEAIRILENGRPKF